MNLSHESLTKNLDILAGLFDQMVADYQRLFNNTFTQPCQLDKPDIELGFTSADLKHYQEPCDGQVGFLVDVGVGHIDQFKF